MLQSRSRCSLYYPPTGGRHRQQAAFWKWKCIPFSLISKNSHRCAAELKESTNINLISSLRGMNQEQQSSAQRSSVLKEILLQRQTGRGKTLSQAGLLGTADNSNHHLQTKDGLKKLQDRPAKVEVDVSLLISQYCKTDQVFVTRWQPSLIKFGCKPIASDLPKRNILYNLAIEQQPGIDLPSCYKRFEEAEASPLPNLSIIYDSLDKEYRATPSTCMRNVSLPERRLPTTDDQR